MPAPRHPTIIADRSEVLREQFAFLLLFHNASEPHPDCNDCKRMALIQVALLKRFE